MRDPGVATVGVVLDDQEPARGRERVANGAKRGVAVADEVEAVRRENAVERAVRDGIRQVEGARLEMRARKGASHPDLELAQSACVAVGRENVGARPEDIGEGERERPLPCPELQPPRAGALDPAADQRDVVSVVHSVMMPERPR